MYIVGEHVIIRANGYQGNFQYVRVWAEKKLPAFDSRNVIIFYESRAFPRSEHSYYWDRIECGYTLIYPKEKNPKLTTIPVLFWIRTNPCSPITIVLSCEMP